MLLKIGEFEKKYQKTPLKSKNWWEILLEAKNVGKSP